MRHSISVLLLLLAMPLAAQEQEIRSANLPPELEWELLRLYDSEAERYEGPATIERTQVVRGDVAASGGPLRVTGEVVGNVAMVGGDVIVEPGGSVTGDITVIGGEVRLGDGSRVGGTITTYAISRDHARPWDHDRPRDRERDRERDRDRDRDRDHDDDWDWDWDDEHGDDGDWWPRRRASRSDRGFARLAVRAGASYNRVEGLPVMFGPMIQTAGSNPLRLEALAIWRSQSGASLDTDRMGYQVKAEQLLGGHGEFSVGASVFSVIHPLDRWQMGDLEASLAAALFHDDYRDYYDRTGWSAFARAEPIRGLEGRVEYRQEDHGARAAGDPWSLFHSDADWRHQPLVAEGNLKVLGGSLELDRRDDRDDPYRGWYGRVSLERPVGGSLTRPALVSADRLEDPLPGSPFFPEAELSTDFTTGQIDVRRYAPVGHGSQLNVRLVGGGSLGGGRLPPQFQHALGGIGTLPGYRAFQADCGARRVSGVRDGERFFPAYGCDRFALAQVEYRGGLSLDFGFGDPDYDDDEWWNGIDIDFSPTWVAFFDAGRGWAQGSSDPATGGFSPDTDTGTLVDVGLGFLLGDIGIYAALPLTDDVDQEPRFFVRLGRRF